MSLKFRNYVTVVLPTFFFFTSWHADTIFSTLVFYNSVCHQELNESLHIHCKNLANFPEEEDHIQRLAAGWTTAMNLGTNIPALLAVLFFGKTTSWWNLNVWRYD